MPIVNRGSTLVPPNARATDVASRMVNHIMPMQQRKIAAAFRPQGIQAVLYNRLASGTACSCKSAETQLSILSPDGKASAGIINRMVSGREFDVTPYTSKPQKLDAQDGFYIDIPNRHDDRQVVGADFEGANLIDNEPGVGDAGAFDPQELDDIVKMFDASDVGFADVACPVCFGTSFVGGYTPYRTWRKVWVPTEFDCDEYIDFTKTPWELAPCSFTIEATLPRGGVAVDAFRVYCGKKVINASPTIDGHAITSAAHALTFFDGLPHVLGFHTDDPVTHVELQVALARESAFFEIPRMPKSGDMAMLERTEPFQILMSPEVPQISSMDVIVESQLGKALLVGSVSPWQTRNRANLGWECQVRVVQPQELYTLLPKRGKVYGPQALNLVPNTKANRTQGI